jgi:Glycosyl hydrolases family 16
MFGHVEFVVKAAPGAGIVSSAVLQSDCLDEIDWEWLGGDNGQVQSNYFGKGITTTYNRGAYHAAPGNHDGFKTYTIDWTSEQIVWQIDGVTVRVMSQANAAEGQYPQTPMMIKVGAWSGGDPGNAPGTIAWAGGPTDYSAGPYTMYLKSIAVTDYSTGTQYTYSGSAGTWQSIQSTGGTINPKGGANTPTDTSNAPAVTSAASSAPLPFEGTHRDDSSTYVTPSVWPWVGTATATLQTAVSTASVTTYPGLPSGWVVMEDGRVLPPSNDAPVSSSSSRFLFQYSLMSKEYLFFSTILTYIFLLQAPSQPSPLSYPSSPASAFSTLSGPEQVVVVTRWDQQGFPVLVTINPNSPSSPASYDSRGGLITATTQPTATGAAQVEGGTNTSGFMFPSAGPAVNGGRSIMSFLRATVLFELVVWLGIEIPWLRLRLVMA